MSENGLLDDLLLRWEELYEQGQDVPAEELCREWPEIVQAVRKRIAALKRVGWVNKQSEGGSERPPSERRSNGHPRPGGFPEGKLAAGMEPIPGCRLIHLQGKGTFGEVWAAETQGTLVAVKFVHGRLAGAERHCRIELELEGLRKIKQSAHPHILGIHHVEVRGSTLAVVTDLADATLEQHFRQIRRHCSPLRLFVRALNHLRGAASALDHLQAEHGLMHLDIKPANLLLVSGRCKLADFGTVKRMRAVGSPSSDVLLSTPAGGVGPEGNATFRFRSCREVPWEKAFGREATLFTAAAAFTPYYAPPEAFLGCTSRSFDQYSLALTFCEIVAGKIPFQGPRDEQVTDRLNGKFELGFLPEPLRPALARALSPAPHERFPTCMAFIEAIQHELEPPPNDTITPHSGGSGCSVACLLQSVVGRALESVSEVGHALVVLSRLGHEPPEVIKCRPGLPSASNKGALRLQRGWTLLKSGDYAGAMEDLTEAVALNPAGAIGYALRGLARKGIGQPERAVEDLTEAIRLDPTTGGFYRIRGEARMSRSDLAGAIEDLTEAIRLDPTAGDFYRIRGEARTEAGDVAGAIMDLTEAIRPGTADATAYRLRGRAYNEAGDYARAIGDLTEAIRLDPKDASAYRLRSRAYDAIGDGGLAVADMTNALRLDPAAGGIGPQRGTGRQNPRDFAGVIEYLAGVIGLDPTKGGIHRIEGNGLSEVGDHALAIEGLTRTIRRNPNDALAYRNRGWKYLQAGDTVRAIEDLTQAIRFKPTVGEFYRTRGEARTEAGDVTGAIEDLTEAIRLDRKDGWACGLRGAACILTGDHARAIGDLTDAVDFYRADAFAYRLRGHAYNETGRFFWAIQDLNTAILLNPSDAVAYRLRGCAYIAIGKPARAIDDLNRAISLDPADGLAFAIRGETRTEAGDLEGGGKDLAEAIRLSVAYASGHRTRRPTTAGNRLDHGNDVSEVGGSMSAADLTSACQSISDPRLDPQDMMRLRAAKAGIPVAATSEVDPPSIWRLSLRRVLKVVVPILFLVGVVAYVVDQQERQRESSKRMIDGLLEWKRNENERREREQSKTDLLRKSRVKELLQKLNRPE